MGVIPGEERLLFEVGQEKQETTSAGYDSHAELVDPYDCADSYSDHSCGDSITAMVEHHAERRRGAYFSSLFSVAVVANLVKQNY